MEGGHIGGYFQFIIQDTKERVLDHWHRQVFWRWAGEKMEMWDEDLNQKHEAYVNYVIST